MALPAPQLEAGPGPSGVDCLRNPWRVGILAAVADPFYFFWWTYQLFKFTRREGFPHARAFWWIFVPFYGLYILWVQLDDLRKAALAVNSEPLNPSLVLGLLIGSLAADRIFGSTTNVSVSLFTLVAGVVLTGAALYIAQSAVSSYLAVKYPFAKHRGMAVGGSDRHRPGRAAHRTAAGRDLPTGLGWRCRAPARARRPLAVPSRS